MGSSTSSEHLPRLAGLVEAALTERVGALIGAEDDLAPFAAALRHPLEAGGKRLRPVLLLATVEALGGDLDPALSSACALELIHTFSLVHDDLPALDDDDLRRGRPTTHVAYGEDVAILVGDGLFALSFRLIAEDPLPDPAARLGAVAELARGAAGGRERHVHRQLVVELDETGAGVDELLDELAGVDRARAQALAAREVGGHRRRQVTAAAVAAGPVVLAAVVRVAELARRLGVAADPDADLQERLARHRERGQVDESAAELAREVR